jgi:hypothetical protein
MKQKPARLRPRALMDSERWTGQQLLQSIIIQLIRHRPGDADHGSSAMIRGDGGAADPRRGDMALAEVGSLLETWRT